MRDFRRIHAWQRAHALRIELNKVSRRFSRLGHGNLRNQLLRAAESIANSIAEGCGASTSKDFAHYLDNAIKSANETENHLLCARDYELISVTEWEKIQCGDHRNSEDALRVS
jgi:four helix bundle protein